MSQKKEGLTAKEKAFCEYYVLHGENATQSYLKAYGGGYESANANGFRVLQRPRVKEYVENLQKEAFESACISAEKVAMKLAEIAFAKKEDKEYNATAQLKALDLLQKQLGLQHQKIEAEVSTDINITIEE